MENENKETLEDKIEAHESGADAKPEAPKKPAKERLYDKIPLNVKQLDIILIVLAVAFVVFLVIGALVGNGVLPEWFDLF